MLGFTWKKGEVICPSNLGDGITMKIDRIMP